MVTLLAALVASFVSVATHCALGFAWVVVLLVPGATRGAYLRVCRGRCRAHVGSMSEAAAVITHLMFLLVEETSVFCTAVVIRDLASFECYGGSVG